MRSMGQRKETAKIRALSGSLALSRGPVQDVHSRQGCGGERGGGKKKATTRDLEGGKGVWEGLSDEGRPHVPHSPSLKARSVGLLQLVNLPLPTPPKPEAGPQGRAGVNRRQRRHPFTHCSPQAEGIDAAEQRRPGQVSRPFSDSSVWGQQQEGRYNLPSHQHANIHTALMGTGPEACVDDGIGPPCGRGLRTCLTGVLATIATPLMWWKEIMQGLVQSSLPRSQNRPGQPVLGKPLSRPRPNFDIELLRSELCITKETTAPSRRDA